MSLYNKIAIGISLGLLLAVCVTESLFAKGFLAGWLIGLGVINSISIGRILWRITRLK